jgi:hypothetical protein
MSTATAAKAVSLETLAQAEFEAGLGRIETGQKYIERLFDDVNDSGEQYVEVRSLVVATRKAVEALQSVESALYSAITHTGGDIDFRP